MVITRSGGSHHSPTACDTKSSSRLIAIIIRSLRNILLLFQIFVLVVLVHFFKCLVNVVAFQLALTVGIICYISTSSYLTSYTCFYVTRYDLTNRSVVHFLPKLGIVTSNNNYKR
jgi:hypothetical protein